jgi:hypothetical protein
VRRVASCVRVCVCAHVEQSFLCESCCKKRGALVGLDAEASSPTSHRTALSGSCDALGEEVARRRPTFPARVASRGSDAGVVDDKARVRIEPRSHCQLEARLREHANLTVVWSCALSEYAPTLSASED